MQHSQQKPRSQSWPSKGMNDTEDLPVSLTQVRCIEQRTDNQEEEEMDLTQEVQVLPLFENLLPEEIKLAR